MLVLDRHGALLAANRSTLTLTGYVREELLGMTLPQLLVPDGPAEGGATIEGLRPGREARVAGRIRLKDGSTAPAELRLRVLPTGLALGTLQQAPHETPAERALRNSERKARTLLEVSCGFVGLLSPEGTLLEANRAALDLVGCELADVVGRPFWDTPWWFHSPEMQDRLKAAITAGARGETARIEATHRAADGSLHSVEFSLRPVRDDAGRVVMCMAEGRDITERRRTEEALRTTEARYRALFESAHDAIILIQGDRFVACNPSALRMFGCTAGDFIGQTPARFSPALQPDGRDSGEKSREKIRAALSGTSASFEWRHCRLDGSEFDAEVSFNSVAIGGEAFMQAIVRDVTERKRSEDRLRTQEQILNSIRTGIVILDNETESLLLANRYAEQVLRGIGAVCEYRALHSLLIRPVGRLSPARDLDEPRTVTAEGRVLGYTVYVPSPRYYWVFVQDITEKLRLETIAESIDTMNNIGYIFSGLRHEIGNPINSIKTTLSVVRSDPTRYAPEAIAELAGAMIDEIARIEYLLRSLKGFNIYESLQPEPLEVNTFVHNFVVLLDAEAHRKGITVSLRLFPEARWVRADARALQQVLLNLWANAMDAVSEREGPVVTISLAQEGDRVLLRLADNGTGMDEDATRQLFRPFFTTKRQGTGLGLVIVKKLLARMSSTVSFQSQRGQGTEVEISLPAESRQAAPDGGAQTQTGR